MLILGLETSCDETGVALYDTKLGLLSHALFSQVDIHVEYGGVVPELASRDHVRKTLPLIEQVLREAGVVAQAIDGVAYTAGPGLAGALMVGATLARSLAWGWGCAGAGHPPYGRPSAGADVGVGYPAVPVCSAFGVWRPYPIGAC